MDSTGSNEELNQRLRSLVLDNASQKQEAAQNPDRPNIPEARSRLPRQDKIDASRQPVRVVQRNADNSVINGAQSIATGQTSDKTSKRGRGSFYGNRGKPDKKSDLEVRQTSILQNSARERPVRGNGWRDTRGPARGARDGSRLFNPRPTYGPRIPSMDEIQAQSLYLEQLVKNEVPKLEMSEEECASKESFRRSLESLLQDAIQQNYHENAFPIKLIAFGSFASGFGMPGSDMDLALIAPQISDDMLRLLEITLLEHHLGARLLTRTRVPILKVCERPSQELYVALREEREKWDAMSLEEKLEHDRGPVRKKDAKNQRQQPSQDDATVEESAEGHSSKSDIGDGGSDSALHRMDDATKPSEHSRTSAQTPSGQGHEPQHPHNKPGELIAQASSQKTTSPTHVQYSHQLERVRRERPTELDRWIVANAPPPDFDLQAALHGQSNNRGPRKERPWYRERPPGPLDFPKHTAGILTDINFSNPLGIHNTALLHAYATCDVRVRLLVLFVKLWASHRKINSGYNGTLSSYGFVLMVLHFLVNICSPPVCPNLQLWETQRVVQSADWPPQRLFVEPDPHDPNQVCEGLDVRFHRNEIELADLARRQLLTHNREPLGALLRGFFIYYATQGPASVHGGFNWTRDVLSLRSPNGVLSKVEKTWTGAKTTEENGGKEVKHRYLFAIEDPFELDHNVARTVTHHGIVAIRDEFRRAARILDKIGQGEPHDEGALLDVIVVEVPKKDEGDKAKSGEEPNPPGEHHQRSQITSASAENKENMQDHDDTQSKGAFTERLHV
ncbi:MAG: hypothetical protein Q9162_003434 [Coniocarpon cinnabarinum]